MEGLYYVADPMCSWCYGFKAEWERARAAITQPVRLVMGGLAPDSDEPMPREMREYVQGAWRSVAQTTGAEFNFDFWERGTPRRSTYASCRAVLAAEGLRPQAGEEMFAAVQRAYYTDARNPSDTETLVQLAVELGLAEDAFAEALVSPETEAALQADLALARELGVRAYPTVVLVQDGRAHMLASGYDTSANVLERLARIAS